MKYLAIPFFVGALLLAAPGCKNPAKGKPKAEVGEAKEVKEKPRKGPVEWAEVNPKNTKIQWVGSKVTGKHEGGFKVFNGRIETDGRTEETTRFWVEIDMNSLYSDHPKLTGHLKSKDFFLVSKYPKAKFVSTSIVKGGKKGATHTVTGNLTLRGVTKSVKFPANIDVTGDHVAARAEFWINRRLWNINYPGMKNDLIRDEVVIKLDVKAKRKKS